MSETVYIVRNGKNGKRRMHTNPDCRFLKGGKGMPKDREFAEDYFELCKYCSGEARQEDPDYTIRNALANSDPEDLGLSPMSGRDA